MFSQGELRSLMEIMKNIAKEECKKELRNRNIETISYGTISAINENGTYNVQIAGTTESYTNILNKSNVTTFSIGDAVMLKAVNGNMGNGYIAIKLGN